MTRSMNWWIALTHLIPCLLLVCFVVNGCSRDGNENGKKENDHKQHVDVDRKVSVGRTAASEKTASGQNENTEKLPEECNVKWGYPIDPRQKFGGGTDLNPLRNNPYCMNLIKDRMQKRMRAFKIRQRDIERDQYAGYDKLQPMQPPKLQKKPIVKKNIVDLGYVKPLLKESVIKIYTDEKNRVKYAVTKHSIYFFDERETVRAKVQVKQDDGAVWFSSNGQWLWQSYVTGKSGKDNALWWTSVYDAKGVLSWKVSGIINSLSPDGNTAIVAADPLYGPWKMVRKGRKKNIEVSGADACAFDDTTVFVSSNKATEIYAISNDTGEKMSSMKFTGGICSMRIGEMNGCVNDVGLVLVACVYSFKENNNVLLIFDSRGKEISKTWFPMLGNPVFYYSKASRLIVAGDAREMILINPVTGKLESKIDPPADLTFEDTRKAGGLDGKYLYHKVSLNDNILVLLRVLRKNEYKSDIPVYIVEIKDLSGRLLFEKKYDQAQWPIVFWPLQGKIMLQEGSKLRQLAIEK